MKTKILAVVVCLVLPMSCPSKAGLFSSNRHIVFEGTVLKMSPPVASSGRLKTFRLVKYRVDKVCMGAYTQSEIVVDHLVLTGKELEGINLGDKVWVTVRKKKNISPRFNAEGIRDQYKKVDAFYIAKSISKVASPLCSSLQQQ